MTICLVSLHSEQWSCSFRDRRALLSNRRGGQLLRRGDEGASVVGDLLRSDSSLRSRPHHPVAPAGPALPAQKLLRGDNRRVLSGTPPHQVTERKQTGGRGEQAGDRRTESIYGGGERGEV